MRTRTAVLLLAVVVLVGGCVRVPDEFRFPEIPDESVALARLAEAEILGAELVEEALGPGHVTSWERTTSVEGCPLLCREGNCHETGSFVDLEGVFELNEVMEAIEQASEAAGGTVREVEQAGLSYFRRVTLTGPSRFLHDVWITWEDGAVRVGVDTGEPGCYRVRE